MKYGYTGARDLTHTKELFDRKKTTRLQWENNVRVAARTPHVASMARTQTGSVLVAGHGSQLSWIGAVEENSAAWAGLMVEGLLLTGNCGELVQKVPMSTYALTKAPKCPKPKFMDLITVVRNEAVAELVVAEALRKMRR